MEYKDLWQTLGYYQIASFNIIDRHCCYLLAMRTMSPISDALLGVQDGDIRKSTSCKITTVAEKLKSTVIIDLTEEVPNNAIRDLIGTQHRSWQTYLRELEHTHRHRAQ